MEKNREIDGQEKTLEQIFAELEDLVGQMDEEESLEESFQLYRRGMDLLKTCSERIDKVEKQMMILDEKGELHEFETGL